MKKIALNLLAAVVLVSCSNVGEELPQFELKTLEGTTITQNDLQGKITVIDVWATWCGNCRNERSALNMLAEKYKDNPSVVLLAVADESPEKVAAFLQKYPFQFTHIPDGIALTDALKTRLVKTYPQHIVLDQQLRVIYEYSGELSSANTVLDSVIAHQLSH